MPVSMTRIVAMLVEGRDPASLAAGLRISHARVAIAVEAIQDAWVRHGMVWASGTATQSPAARATPSPPRAAPPPSEPDPRRCQFIAGTPPKDVLRDHVARRAVFCWAPAVRGPYCAEHAERCYLGESRRVTAAEKAAAP
jgi:hypothetical protein